MLSCQTRRLWRQQRWSRGGSRYLSTRTAVEGLDKVLVANRGEIACRVIRTCQRLGIPTVALYSLADGPEALHARMADESYRIGTGPSPTESYLLQEEVLGIARRSGARAIHPGYGFLSENASFAKAVHEEAGIHFVGPPPAAIRAMGSKSESKALMETHGVPTTPGYYGDDNQDADFLFHQAVTKVGFPLLIKAVMGGGGKGMRLVWEERDFLEALASCQRESQASFGDSRVLLEKYLVRPRHVEVQIVADSYGNVVHLYERDCSLQRRHQKIIEEAPASDLDPGLRERLGEMGKRAARAVGYVNAGTVEFLLDSRDPTNNNFYFCEMNTRLQVEHPITEQITGIDLVEWQLRIAAGEKLPIPDQTDVPCSGHALEARIYAENPARNFLPGVGTVWYHVPPTTSNTGASSEGVRVDTGIAIGQEVGVHYDPMISKLVVHDETREKALDKLVSALQRYRIAGVPTNIEFLVKCAKHEAFRTAGAINTGFLEDYAEEVKVEDHDRPTPKSQVVAALVTQLYLENRFGIPKDRIQPNAPWSSFSGSWRMGGLAGRAVRQLKLSLEENVQQEEGEEETVKCICNRDGSYDIEVVDNDGNTQSYHARGSFTSSATLEVVLNETHRLQVSAVVQERDDQICVRLWPERPSDADGFYWAVNFQNPRTVSQSEGRAKYLGEGTVKTPMPGKVTRTNHSAGDTVREGDIIMVLEAMKMEHPIKAPKDGVLEGLSYKVGDLVAEGSILFTVEDNIESEETGSG